MRLEKSPLAISLLAARQLGLELDLAQRIPDLLVIGIILLLTRSCDGETRQHEISPLS